MNKSWNQTPHKPRRESIHAKGYSTHSYSQNTTAIAKPIRPPRKHPPAAEMIHTKTSAVRLPPATRLRNYPGRTNPDTTQKAPRCRRRQRGERPPARRSATPPGAATAQPRTARRPRADRLGPRTREGPQGISPCGPFGAICAPPAAPPIAIGAGPSGGPAARNGERGAKAHQNAERPARGESPLRAFPAHAAHSAHLLARKIEKRPPRARRPALPQPGAAVLSAKAGLTAGFGMGPGDPRLCGRARGGRSPAAHDIRACQEPLVRGDPGGRMAGTEEDGASRSVL